MIEGRRQHETRLAHGAGRVFKLLDTIYTCLNINGFSLRFSPLSGSGRQLIRSIRMAGFLKIIWYLFLCR